MTTRQAGYGIQPNSALEDPEWQYDGIGDPAVLVDRVANTIWVAATWSHGNRSWNGSQPGLAPEETGQLMLVSSKDDGRTWSEPINITSQIKDPAWCFLLQGPGRGITMGNGTMVFPAQYQDPPDRKRLPHSTIIYSRDHGKTWEIGTGAFDDTTESAVAELPDGSLMLSCRYNRQNRRVVAITHDLGKTWTEHPTSRLSVPEPGACQASLLSVNRELRKDVGCWLLMSNPNVGDRPRRSMTIKASYDDGMTWPQSQQVLLDEGASAGYSALSMIDDKTVGILYEGSLSHLTFQRVPLADLLGAGKPKPGGTSDKLPVFILTGQSNSLGTTADPKEKDISPGSHAADAERRFFWSNRSTRAGDGPAALYGSSEGEIVPLKVQQGEGKHPYFWGPEFGFSRALHDSDLRNFLVVKASRGGGGNSFWLKGTGNDQMYTHIVKTVKEAIAALPEGVDYEIAALLYLQGESDSPAEARVAGERLGALITNLRTDLPHANRMCAVIAGIGAAGANDHTVREQQRTLAANDPSISYFDNTDLQAGLYDRLHFNKPAKLIIGRRFAHAYLRLAHPESALP
ncbi:MAG: hypothetical protein HN742_12930 [Lentisphaerae bacterium]|jgi:hypothetical protein|nr:hypothetical protein [Lentisphaerota bacterium]MBT5604459.1 hypothetical protein [Lentisphaerota bacterium]MBT7842774.1 hypothetical protein [Lentisphaerota bacterium]